MSVRLHQFDVLGHPVRVVKDTRRGDAWYVDLIAEIGHTEIGTGATIAAALEAAAATLAAEPDPAPTRERPSPHGRDRSRLAPAPNRRDDAPADPPRRTETP